MLVHRASIAVLCLIALTTLTACGDSSPGYHVNGADADSFESLTGSFARDKNHVYYDGQEMTGADPASFHWFSSSNYARDRSHVYYERDEVIGADPASFDVVLRPRFDSNWGKDRSHVWLEGKPISDDPAGFELLDGDLAKDGKAVYCGDGSVLSNDPTHFAIVLVNGGTIPVFTKGSHRLLRLHAAGRCRPGNISVVIRQRFLCLRSTACLSRQHRHSQRRSTIV
jgi:DKNYY family